METESRKNEKQPKKIKHGHAPNQGFWPRIRKIIFSKLFVVACSYGELSGTAILNNATMDAKPTPGPDNYDEQKKVRLDDFMCYRYGMCFVRNSSSPLNPMYWPMINFTKQLQKTLFSRI